MKKLFLALAVSSSAFASSIEVPTPPLPSSATLGTTAPLTGGGTLSSNLTLSIPASSGSVDGYLSSANFTVFNNKVATTRAINTTAPITGGGALSADRTIAIPKATGAVDGYLSAADFTTFANSAPSIGGAVTSGTTGSVLFVGAGPVLAQDNAKLFYDVTNHRLAVGNVIPVKEFEVSGTIRSSGANYSVDIFNGDGNGPVINFGDKTTGDLFATIGVESGGTVIDSRNARPLILWNSGSEYARFTSGGAFIMLDTGGHTGNVPHIQSLETSTTNTSATCAKTCAAGEVLTGGGCSNSGTDLLINNYPSSTTTWSCKYGTGAGNCTASAMCYAY